MLFISFIAYRFTMTFYVFIDVVCSMHMFDVHVYLCSKTTCAFRFRISKQQNTFRILRFSMQSQESPHFNGSGLFLCLLPSHPLHRDYRDDIFVSILIFVCVYFASREVFSFVYWLKLDKKTLDRMHKYWIVKFGEFNSNSSRYSDETRNADTLA